MQKPKNTPGNHYLKYTGLAFQLAALVAVAIFAGQWLDKRFMFEGPYFTVILVFVFFGGFLYKLYLELNSSE
jgi:hypothetical protein